MANRNRGEMEVKLGDRIYTLKASFEAICELEDRLDKGLPELLVRIGQRSRFGIKELAAIFHCGLLGQPKAPNFDEVGRLVLASKMAALQTPAYLFLAELWHQGQPEQAEAGEGDPEKKEQAQG